jgi:Zn-dependent protease with chaperone function
MDSASENPVLANDTSVLREPSAPMVMVEGAVEAVKVSPGYQLGLVAVALAMIILPVLYVAFIALFGYGVYYHATVNRSVFDWYLPGRLGFIKVLVYFGPIVIGSILFLFLIKPLFVRRGEPEPTYSLDHAEAPLLFQLIGQVCRAIGAPIPSRIDLDCTINASASFRKGFASFFGNDVVLTLGLPLVGSLTIQQLAGLLAHEFGHFAQGAAMRLTYVIRSVNAWFARVVYERDVWDLWLIEASEEVDFRIGWILYLARLGVWISRRVLWVTMMIGHGISSFMLRQMEYDADRYELRIAGTEAFITTNRQINHLNAAAAALRKEVRARLKERKLFDNTPELVVRYARDVPADVQARLHASWEGEKTKWNDSHPCYRERNARAVAAAEVGCVQNRSPASTLFSDFSKFCRSITLAQYRDQFGCEIPEEALIPVQPAAAMAEHDYASDQQIVKDYFKGVATGLRPIRLPSVKGFSFRNADALIQDVQEVMVVVESLFPAAHSAYLDFKDADSRELSARQALTLIEAGIEFDAAELGLTDTAYEGVNSVLMTAEQQKQQAATVLEPYERAVLRRFTASLHLISMAPVASKIENATALHDEADELLWLLGQLSLFFDEALRLRTDCARLEWLLRYRQDWSNTEGFASTAKNLTDEISRDIEAIQKASAGTRLPLPGGAGFIGGFLKNKEYCADPVELVLREGMSHFEKTISLYYQALARLVTIANHVEQAIPIANRFTPTAR